MSHSIQLLVSHGMFFHLLFFHLNFLVPEIFSVWAAKDAQQYFSIGGVNVMHTDRLWIYLTTSTTAGSHQELEILNVASVHPVHVKCDNTNIWSLVLRPFPLPASDQYALVEEAWYN